MSPTDMNADMSSCVFFGIFSVLMSLGRAGLAKCNAEDCPEGYFCHENTCKKCLRCDLLFRKGNFCVTDFNDCKECIKGFEEVLLTENSHVVKPCKPMKKKVKLKTCENDSSCPQNNYCNEESCVKCFDCGILNRVPPGEKCAKGLNDCGSCMIGFYEVSVTVEARYKPCEKNSNVLPEFRDWDQISLAAITPPLCLMTMLLLVATFMMYKRWKDQSASKTSYHRPIYPSAPPLHSLNSPELVRTADGSEPTFLGYVEEKKQQAKPFREPTAAYYYYPGETVRADHSPTENNNESYIFPGRPPVNDRLPSSLSNEHSEIDLNELGVDSLAHNINDQSETHVNEAIFLDVIDGRPIAEDSHEDDTNNSGNTQTTEEKVEVKEKEG